MMRVNNKLTAVPEPRTLQRTGSAAVELAICLPVVSVIVWGTFDLSSMLHARRAVQAAAYHAVTLSAVEGGTDAETISLAQSLLAQRGITGGTVTVTHSTVQGLSATTVVIQTPAVNTLSGVWLRSQPIEARCTAVKHRLTSS